LGPSGCGKTTTLRCIAGLEIPDDGEISIGGELFTSGIKGVCLPPEKRHLGMVFQSYAIWPHMSVAENVAYGLQAQGVPRKEVKGKVDQALELVGLGGLGERNATKLSGGQQQRVSLARAVAYNPRVLLFDEPLSNLDAKLRERMRLELVNLVKDLKLTALYVTHDQAEAMVILRGRNKKLSSVVDYVATLPIGVPGLVMGMAFLITWIKTPLYSFPLFLLMLAYMTRYLPYGLRTITAILQSLSAELEESSRVCGESFIGTIRKVTVPLLRPGIFAAYLMLFIMFIWELPVSALLATEESTPMAVALYVISENEALGVVSAFALVQVVLLLIGTIIFRRLGNIEKLSV
jgi:ABC-type nitrate/sulfonate/bicarbonate transport system ATPase subunit